MSVEECNIDYENSDEPDVDNNDLPNAIILRNTHDITESIIIPDYIPCTFEGNVKQEMSLAD